MNRFAKMKKERIYTLFETLSAERRLYCLYKLLTKDYYGREKTTI